MPGPIPKPDPQRRNKPMANTVKLPAKGRTGRTPAWPVAATRPHTWAPLWRTPQATAWERLGWNRIVARYALVLELVENPATMTGSMLGEARHLEDRLGLTPMAMLRLRWEVSADGERARKPATPPSVEARRRLKVVDPAVAERKDMP